MGLAMCAVVTEGEFGALTAELYVGRSIVLIGRTGVFTAVL